MPWDHTCYPAAVTFPPLPQPKLVLDLATPEGSKVEFTWAVVISQDTVCLPKTVTYLRNIQAVEIDVLTTKPCTEPPEAHDRRTKNSHEKHARNRTRSIWCEKLARDISCCKSVWHAYKFLARVNSHEFLVEFLVRVSWACIYKRRQNHAKLNVSVVPSDQEQECLQNPFEGVLWQI